MTRNTSEISLVYVIIIFFKSWTKWKWKEASHLMYLFLSNIKNWKIGSVVCPRNTPNQLSSTVLNFTVLFQHLFCQLFIRYIKHHIMHCDVIFVFVISPSPNAKCYRNFTLKEVLLWVQCVYACVYSVLQDTGGFWILITSWSSWVMWLSWWIQSHGLWVKCLSVCVWRSWHL